MSMIIQQTVDNLHQPWRLRSPATANQLGLATSAVDRALDESRAAAPTGKVIQPQKDPAPLAALRRQEQLRLPIAF